MAAGVQVLCVDDEPGFLEMGKAFLEKRNEFSVDTATSATAALEILNSKSYDAIISDYAMPEMDGIEFLKRVRATNSTIPFILFTGRGREEVVIEALNNGADFYLQKGTPMSTVYTELSHVIRQSVQMRRTQLTFAEQEQRYHDILNTSDLIQTVAPDGQFLFVNARWLDTLGYQEQDIKDLSLFDVIHEDSVRSFRDTFGRILSGEDVGIIDTVFRTRSGKKVYAEGMADAMVVSGVCQYVRGEFRDVTARKEAERRLIESEQKFATVFEKSPNPLLIARVADARILNANRAFLDLGGYTLEEVMGKSPVDLGWISVADAGEIASRMAQDGRIENAPVALSVKGGTTIQVLLSMIEITVADQPAHVMVITETSRLKRAEEDLLLKNRMLTAIEKELRADYEAMLRQQEELSASEYRYRMLFENMLDGFAYCKILYDEAGTPADFIYLKTNRAFSQLTGLSDVAGKRVTELIPGIREISPELFEVCGRVVRTGTPEIFEFFFKPLKKWNNLAVFSLEQDTFVMIFDDITERKFAEEALKQTAFDLSERMKELRCLLSVSSTLSTATIDRETAIIRILEAIPPAFMYPEITTARITLEGRVYTTENFRETGWMLRQDIRCQGKTIGGIEVAYREMRPELAVGPFLQEEANLIAGIAGRIGLFVEQQNAQDALRESEVMFRSIFTGGAEGILIVDLTTRRITHANPMICRMLGYAEDELRAMNVEDIHPREHLAYVKGEFEAIARGEKIQTGNIPLRCKDGSIINTDVVGSRNILNGTLCNIGFFTDASERVKAEEVLRESEEKYRVLVENAQEGIAVVQGGRYVFFNSWLTRIGGYTEEELSVRPVLTFVHEEDRDTVLSHQELLRQGARSVEPFTIRMYHKSGEVRWIDVKSTVILWNGLPATLDFYTDITFRKKAEEALRESEKRYRDMFEINNAVMLIIDPQTTMIVDANTAACNFYGYSREEMRRMSMSSINVQDPLTIMKAMSHAADRNGAVFHFPHRKKGGEIREVEVFSAPVMIGGRKLLHSIIQDITERKRAEDALLMTNKKLSLLSGITRHDINNQLTGLNGYLTLLHEKMTDPADEDYFSRIATITNQIADMIRFTREYEHVGVNAPVWQDLKALVNTAWAEVSPGNVILKNDLSPGSAVFADPLITRVFFNLIENALRHGGKITMIRFSSLKTRHGDWIVACEDDGDGIPADVKDRIFEKGFGKNTGFGLFISRQILDITGITIRETGVPGKGARFEIRIPKGAYRVSGSG